MLFSFFFSVPDSWGRLPFGLLWGHSLSFGQYEECIAIKRKFTDTDTLKGKYCLAKVPIKGFFGKIKKDNVARISYKYKDPEYFELGICVPKSCSVAKSNELLKRVIKKFYNQDIKAQMVTESFCKADDPIELRGIDIFAM